MRFNTAATHYLLSYLVVLTTGSATMIEGERTSTTTTMRRGLRGLRGLEIERGISPLKGMSMSRHCQLRHCSL